MFYITTTSGKSLPPLCVYTIILNIKFIAEQRYNIRVLFQYDTTDHTEIKLLCHILFGHKLDVKYDSIKKNRGKDFYPG
jgi:hypothetical protein